MRTTGLFLAVLLSTGVYAQAPPKIEQDLRMADIVHALDVEDGSKVADIGAGSGSYEPALARAAGPGGRVYAEDISAEALKGLRERVEKEHLASVEVVEGTPDDPKLPSGSLDGALMVIMYHEIENHEKILQHVLASLKPGGRLVVVDMTPHKTITRPRADQVKNHVINPDIAEAEIRQAGFDVISRDDHFIDHPDEESTRWMIAFRKPR